MKKTNQIHLIGAVIAAFVWCFAPFCYSSFFSIFSMPSAPDILSGVFSYIEIADFLDITFNILNEDGVILFSSILAAGGSAIGILASIIASVRGKTFNARFHSGMGALSMIPIFLAIFIAQDGEIFEEFKYLFGWGYCVVLVALLTVAFISDPDYESIYEKPPKREYGDDIFDDEDNAVPVKEWHDYPDEEEQERKQKENERLKAEIRQQLRDELIEEIREEVREELVNQKNDISRQAEAIASEYETKRELQHKLLLINEENHAKTRVFSRPTTPEKEEEKEPVSPGVIEQEEFTSPEVLEMAEKLSSPGVLETAEELSSPEEIKKEELTSPEVLEEEEENKEYPAFCPFCGERLTDRTALFCGLCGSAIQ